LEALHTIIERAKIHFSSRLPFVIYCKPGQNQVNAFFQKNSKLYLAKDFTETGFVLAPFDGKKYVLIPEHGSEIKTADFVANENYVAIPELTTNQTGKTDFENLVQKGINAIKAGHFEKVVLSRKETISLENADFLSLFEKLLQTYPTAFRYCWFHPEIGLWLGATPERLLKSENKKFYTMALAGTQKFEDTENVEWQQKEKAEQRFVTDFIIENLEDAVSEIAVSKPYTAKAGNLLHLKTDIEGVLNDTANLKQVVEILHPTPAVCGFPKAEAKAFILANEGYDREYYSGFLGESNHNFENGKTGTDLYVNLRCMQLKGNEAHLYMGCGITNDSDPEKEYLETVNKSMTIKKII
jgi:isochorismate synthase